MARQNNVSLTMDCQEADFWCWAAVTQSIDARAGRSTTQAQVATTHVRTPCTASDRPDAGSACGSPCAGKCNSPHRLSQVLVDSGHSVRPIRVAGLTFQEVVDVIDDGDPLPLRIAITTGSMGGHFICVTGYAEDDQGNQFVEILDPLVPGIGRGSASARDIPFDSLASGRYRINGDEGIPNFKYELS